ncbi:MAG: polyphosphate kinase 2 family protein [Actinomycetota bacterium]
MPDSTSDPWLARPGEPFDIASVETGDTRGAPGGAEQTTAALGALREQLIDFQQRLWAEHKRSLLVIFQAMDTGGKDGVIRHVFSGINPQGVRVTSFKAPTPEELDHDFLWRIHRFAPGRGEIAVFNRSHYEDVGIVRVHNLVPEYVWRERYELIRAFERQLEHGGTVIRKFYLHISKQEQKKRLQARLNTPTKRWKFNAGDLAERSFWDQYRSAYQEAIEQTTTPSAPWYVIPAGRKWYRDWAVATVLAQTLTEMDPRYPEPPDLAGVKID